MSRAARLLALLKGDAAAEKVVPPSGFTAQLTVFTAATMAFLAVFALALSLATDRLATRWGEALGQSVTIRIAASEGDTDAQAARVLEILGETPGVASARALDDAEERALLAPWFGEDLPLDSLPVPQLIEVIETGRGFDPEGLAMRLRAEAPDAVIDDHRRWRRPLIRAAHRLHLLGIGALGLILLSMAAMISLAAHAALAANGQVLEVLRQVGARDAFIARAFVRRFTLRAGAGAIVGTLAGVASMALLPDMEAAGGFLTGLGFAGAGWLAPLLIPPLAGFIAFWATRHAALRALKEIP